MSDQEKSEKAYRERVAGLSKDDAMVHALSVINNTAVRDGLSGADVRRIFVAGLVARQVILDPDYTADSTKDLDVVAPANDGQADPGGEVSRAAA